MTSIKIHVPFEIKIENFAHELLVDRLMDDLASLPVLDKASLIQCLEQRFKKGILPLAIYLPLTPLTPLSRTLLHLLRPYCGIAQPLSRPGRRSA